MFYFSLTFHVHFGLLVIILQNLFTWTQASRTASVASVWDINDFVVERKESVVQYNKHTLTLIYLFICVYVCIGGV
jgi:hypothetical protein